MDFAPDYGAVACEADLETLVSRLIADNLPFGIDIETGFDGPPRPKAQLHPEEGFIVGISLTNSLRWARYIPLRHDSGPNLGNARVAELLWPLVNSGLAVAHGGKFELRFLSRWFAQYLGDHPVLGPEVRDSHLGNPAFPGYFPLLSDSCLEAHAEGKSRELGLKYLTEVTFGHRQLELAALFALHTGKELTKTERDSMRFSALDLMGTHRSEIIDYACEDALWALAHHMKRYPQVKDNLIYKIEMAVLPIVCAMEDEGILYDWAFTREGALRGSLFRDKWAAEVQDDLTALLAERGITEPCRINLGSSQQVSKVLYDQLGLSTRVMTKGGKSGERKMSTGKVAMAGLAKDHPVVKRILNWKSLTRLVGTYLEAYPRDYSYAPDGRTHPSWIQTGVPAGRFACAAPPTQQSPKRYHYVLSTGEEFSFNFRDSIKAPDGWYILGFDYSQAELRALAGEAHEEALVEAFRKGEDVHSKTASLMLGIPLPGVNGESRAIGKVMNFALGYSMGVEGLADRLGITKPEAQDLFDQYFAAYPGIKKYMEGVVAASHRDGCVWTRFGRRVPISYEGLGGYATGEMERTAGNAPIQGAGTGDYPKIAMVRSHAALRSAGLLGRVRLVMNMHDALEWYVRDDVPPLEVIRVLQPAVVFTHPLIAHWPPMVAEWHMGRRWGSVRELNVELDEAGVPSGLSVREDSQPAPAGDGDGEGLALEVSGAEVRALVGAGTGAGPAGGTSPAAGGHGLGTVGVASRGPLTSVQLQLSEMPELGAMDLFLRALAREPGPNGLTLRTPEGDIPLNGRFAFEPDRAPEASLMLGVQVRAIWSS